jgi:hypothetical protein
MLGTRACDASEGTVSSTVAVLKPDDPPQPINAHVAGPRT